MGKYKLHIIWALIAVVALVGGIFWGKSMGAAGARSGFAGSFASSTRGTFAGRTGTAGGGVYTGQVLSMASSSLTLQLANGNSEVIFYSASTPVTEPETVSPSKLAAGTNIVVMGTTNSDGSVTASSIEVANGSGGFFGGGEGGAARGQATSTASQ